MINPQDKRKQEADLLQTVQLNRQEPGLQALRRLLELRLAKQDSLLRRCPPADFAREQAIAYVTEQLLREINS